MNKKLGCVYLLQPSNVWRGLFNASLVRVFQIAHRAPLDKNQHSKFQFDFALINLITFLEHFWRREVQKVVSRTAWTSAQTSASSKEEFW